MSWEFYIDPVITKHIAKSVINTPEMYIDWLTPIRLYWTETVYLGVPVCTHIDTFGGKSSAGQTSGRRGGSSAQFRLFVLFPHTWFWFSKLLVNET